MSVLSTGGRAALSYLEKMEIALGDLISTALELFVPHRGVERREKAIEIITEVFHDTFSDVNVSCLVVACYLAGAREIFEFVRFDQAKAGILSRLGPIVIDAVGGLVAGCSSNMYSRATRSQMV